MAIMDKSKKMENEELKEVNGGYLFGSGDHLNDKWEVIDDNTGEVLAKFQTWDEAERAAREQYGMSTEIIFWDKLRDLRSK